MAPTVQLNEDVGQLQQAYVNEKCAPLLLPFAAELISKMFDVMDLQEERLLPSEAERDAPDGARGNAARQEDALRPYIEAELERMRWLVRAYLRVRLQKVNTNCVAILETPELRARLSEEELRYAEGYLQLVHNHATSTVTARLAMLTALSVEEGARLLPKPDDEYVVFCRAEEELGDVDLGDENGTITLRQGSAFVSKYRHIEPYLIDGEPGCAKLALF